MPFRKIGAIAGAVVVGAAGLWAAIYYGQGGKMPEKQFALVAGSLVVVVVVSGLVWFFARVLVPTWTFLSKFTYRWPMVSKSKPDPNQWLFAIAAEDAADPSLRLIVLGQKITGIDLKPETERPYVDLELTLYNGGVHAIAVGRATGRPWFNGAQLGEEIQSRPGGNKPRGHVGRYWLRQYLTDKTAVLAYQEIRKGRLQSLSLANRVTIEVKSLAKDGTTVQMPIGGNDVYLTNDA